MKQYDDDDGRKIADMSGVTTSLLDIWFVPKRRRHHTLKPIQKEEKQQGEYIPLPPPTKAESRAMMFQAMFASLLIALVFIAGAALFILFCIHIWFK